MDTDTPPSDARPSGPDAGDDLAGLGEDLAETIADIREQGRWLVANLREMAGAFGLGRGSTAP